MHVKPIHTAGLGLACSIIMWSASASAQQPAPGPYPPAPAPGYPPPGYQQPAYQQPAYQQPAYGPPPGYPAVAASADPTARRHDGFYLRMMLGPGYLRSTGEEGTSEMTLKGAGAGFELAIGGAVAENFIIYGNLLAYSATNPTLELSGGGVSGSGELEDASFSSGGLGAGIAYYIMPMNLQIGGGVVLVSDTLKYKNPATGAEEEAESDSGIGVQLSLGKEWFVSDQWGLGVTGQLYGAKVDEFTTTGFSINFAATFN